MYNIGSTPGGETELAKAVYDVLFEGTQEVDWHNVFNAKIDKRFVRTISDKVTTIQSGNDEAIYRNYKKWYPVNGNMHYNEKEEGDKIKDDMDIATLEMPSRSFQLMALLVWVIYGSLTFSHVLAEWLVMS